MSGSTVTVFGAKMPLREGVICEAEVYRHEANYYVGGQSARSFDVAWSLLDRLLGDKWASVDRPSPCASLRFGNCVHVRAYAPGYAWHIHWGKPGVSIAVFEGGRDGNERPGERRRARCSALVSAGSRTAQGRRELP